MAKFSLLLVLILVLAGLRLEGEAIGEMEEVEEVELVELLLLVLVLQDVSTKGFPLYMGMLVTFVSELNRDSFIANKF